MLMNLTTIALALLAYKLLSGNSTASKGDTPKVDFGQFLNDDTQSLLQSVSKLQDKAISQEEKSGAIFQLLTNPAVLSILNNLSGGKSQDDTTQSSSQQQQEEAFAPRNQQDDCPQQQPANAHQNDEGYTFRAPSEEAKQGFAPIEKIAGVEVSHKLYALYDNWYAKPSKK